MTVDDNCMYTIVYNATYVARQWQIVSVMEAMSCRAKQIFLCRAAANFFQKRAPVHSKIKLLFFFPRVYHVLCTRNTTSLSFSSDVASRRLLSYKVRYRTDSVAAKAYTAVTVPTPLFGLVAIKTKCKFISRWIVEAF